MIRDRDIASHPKQSLSKKDALDVRGARDLRDSSKCTILINICQCMYIYIYMCVCVWIYILFLYQLKGLGPENGVCPSGLSFEWETKTLWNWGCPVVRETTPLLAKYIEVISHAYIYTYTYIHIYIYLSIYLSTYVLIYTHVQLYVHLHMHINS